MNFKYLFFGFILGLLIQPFESRANNKIVRGKNATAVEKPWVVRIRPLEYKTWCTGTLISSKWVITAAHCFHAGDDVGAYVVEGGGTGQAKDLKVLSKIKSVSKHPNFSTGAGLWDVALVRLAQEVEFSADVTAIRLKDLTNVKLVPGDKVNISGWGYVSTARTDPTHLQTMTAQVVRPVDMGAETPQFIRSLGLDKKGYLATVDEATTCNGDSGTGWTMNSAGENFLVGVHVAGDYCKSIAVSLELSHLLPFITQATGIVATE